MQRVIVTDECVKKIGRTMQIDQTLWMGLSGTGVEFSFSGMSLVVTIVGGPVSTDPAQEGSFARVAIYVDDERVVDDILNQKEKKYVIFDGTRENHGVIRVIKLSESPMSVMGIAPFEIGDMDWMQPTPAKDHLMEVIGDSITCGYGVDDEDAEHHFSTATEDTTRAYAYRTAKALDVDYSFVSASGYGIISGYTAEPEVRNSAELIPPYYESMGFSRDFFPDQLVPHSVKWDFAAKQPELIVINLGTNDDSFCQENVDKQNEYRDKYIEFIKVIRRNNPNAQILCVLGLMGARLYPVICKVVEMYQAETGDMKIDSFELPEQDGSIGYVADYHPLSSAHEKAAKALTQKIKELMNW